MKLKNKKLECPNKTFIVGDIHGCYDEFLKLLDKINYSPKNHRLILLGDIINRGPKSLEVLKWIKKNHIEVVLGNHELAFLKEAKSGVLRDSFKILKNQMGAQFSSWVNWMKSWPLYIEEDTYVVVHAGIVPDEHPSQSNPHYLVYIRQWDAEKGVPVKRAKESLKRAEQDKMFPPWYTFYKGKKLIIYGHWAEQGLKLRENTIGLDTGCVYGGHLSGLFLPSKKVVQVKALKAYYHSDFSD